jgi:hypothetical protein
MAGHGYVCKRAVHGYVGIRAEEPSERDRLCVVLVVVTLLGIGSSESGGLRLQVFAP